MTLCRWLRRMAWHNLFQPQDRTKLLQRIHDQYVVALSGLARRRMRAVASRHEFERMTARAAFPVTTVPPSRNLRESTTHLYYVYACAGTKVRAVGKGPYVAGGNRSRRRHRFQMS